jgi:hypothetical protein
MGFLDKVKEQAEQAATKAREGVQDVQAKRELDRSYRELGEAVFGLVERGELTHAELAPFVARIREVKAGLEEEPAEEQAEAPPPVTPV